MSAAPLSPVTDDALDALCEPAPETKAASRPALRTRAPGVVPSDVRTLTRRIDRQNARLEAIASRASAGPSEARRRIDALRQRRSHEFRQMVDARDRTRPSRRDPLTERTLERLSGAIDETYAADRREVKSLKREVATLTRQVARPHGPTMQRMSQRGGRSERSALVMQCRAATLAYLRHGTEVFAGVHLKELQRRAHQTQIGPDGGYLVKPEHDTGPIERVLQVMTPMRQVATIRQISAGSFKTVVNVGGGSAVWVDEITARSDTNTPQVDELEFPAMELYARPKATQQILEDAMIDLEAWIAEEVAIQFSEAEGVAFVSGNGVKRPRGLLSYTNVANALWTFGNVGYVATGVAAALTDGSNNGGDRLIELVYALRQGYRAGASFLMNKGTMAKIRQFKGSDGQYLLQEAIHAQSADMFPKLLGYMIAEDENMPDIGAGAFPIAFGDLKRAYIIVDRVGMTVLRDPYTQEPFVVFKTRKRVGGGIKNFEAVKLLKVATS